MREERGERGKEGNAEGERIYLFNLSTQMCIYLPNTVKLAVAIATPAELFTLQVYLPWSPSLTSLTTRVDPPLTSCPLCTHRMMGLGIPTVKQENMADCPTCAATLFGGTVMVGATAGVVGMCVGRECVWE